MIKEKQDRMIKKITDYFNNITPEQLEKDLEAANNSGFGKAITRMLGCDDCLKRNGECQHCVLGSD